MTPRGRLVPVLHAHLPFVRHPEHADYLEEDWLFEAVVECYAPILSGLERLLADGVRARLAMSFTPTLCAMLDDDLLKQRLRRYLEQRLDLAEREVRRTGGDSAFSAAATMYRDRFRAVHEWLYGRCEGDLLNSARELARDGALEILSCSATHAYLPLLADPAAASAQLAVAIESHRRFFGHPPAGIWLPECGFQPGIDRVLADHGIRFFFLESHGVLLGSPAPRFGVHAPVVTPSGVAVFPRDPECSQQVWSADEGYPGDPVYRDFYRDVGWDLPLEIVRPYLHSDGSRGFTGLKYHRITGKTDRKEPYDPAAALARVREHAAHFVEGRVRQAERLSDELRRTVLMTAPYDAELFGHWWFEGPDFLEAVFRELDGRVEIEAATPSEWLEKEPVLQLSMPSFSSWGDGGYAGMWLSPENDWIWPHLHAAQERMSALARRAGSVPPAVRRALDQAGRELLLAQSSDWPFILKTGTNDAYASRRFREHLSAFRRLAAAVESGSVDDASVAAREARTPLFPFLDARVFDPTARLVPADSAV